jgi:hypothetical protein
MFSVLLDVLCLFLYLIHLAVKLSYSSTILNYSIILLLYYSTIFYLSVILILVCFLPFSLLQVLQDVSAEAASTVSFANAVKSTVHDIIGLNICTVTSAAVTAVSGRRQLLTSTTLAYTVALTSTLTSEQVVKKLQDSMSSGLFLRTLRSYSGIVGQQPGDSSTVIDANAETKTETNSTSESLSMGK